MILTPSQLMVLIFPDVCKTILKKLVSKSKLLFKVYTCVCIYILSIFYVCQLSVIVRY